MTTRKVPYQDADKFERGYRAWRLGFVDKEIPSEVEGLSTKTKEPRLFPINASRAPWEPGEHGEIKSDWEESKDEPLEGSNKGLYSLKSYGELKNSGYHSEGDISGSIIPYGKVVHGDKGYRAEKAKVAELFRRAQDCRLCSGPASKLVTDTKTGESTFLCETCQERLKRLLEKPRFSRMDLEELLQTLARIYEAEVVDEPVLEEE